MEIMSTPDRRTPDCHTLDRRTFAAALPALAALAADAQTTSGTLGKTRVFPPQLTAQPNGSERWAILSGTLDTGEAVAMHESVVPAGAAPSAPHKILHSELIAVVEGTLELFADGVTSQAPTGSILYIAYGTNHFVRNSGAGPARYIVWQMGGDTRRS
jgi:quercetin dioxygenase-like cupin family protein